MALDKTELLRRERRLAKYAKLMDGVIRIPFTRKGVGLDALLSLLPIAGDAAGFLLTLYAFKQARNMGVPSRKLMPALKWAAADAIVGSVPVLGTIFDIFIKPSKKTLDIVREHLAETHGIAGDAHVQSPFLHSYLEKKQAQSAVWRNPVIAWLWMRLPALLLVLALALVVLMGWLGWQFLQWLADTVRTA